MEHNNHSGNPKHTGDEPPDSTVAVLEVVEIDIEIERLHLTASFGPDVIRRP